MTVSVAVDNQMYPLQPHPTVPFLYSGMAPGESAYRYVLLDSSSNMADYESFDRPALKQVDRTFNEVYGRPWNHLQLPTLPKIYDIPFDHGSSPLYQDGVIAHLLFEFDPVALDQLHSDKMNVVAKIEGKMTFISYDHVQQFDQVSLKVGGHSSRTWAKVPYKVKLKTQEGLYDRWSLKLRPEATDATMMREKLYSDILQASGVVGPQGTYARVYFNGRPVGLYLITDDVVDESFLRQTIHHGSEQVDLGMIIKADGGKGEYAADLAYHGDVPEGYDALVYEVKEGDGMTGLIGLTKFIAQFDLSTHPTPKDSAALFDQWNRVIHLPHFLRQVACEWLGGNWDATVYSGNNYVLYKHPKSQQFITIPMDFDFTFGNGLEADQQKLMTGQWIDFSAQRMVHSYLWEKIMSVPFFQEMYMEALGTINDKVTHPTVLLPRAHALAYMLAPEVAWDHSIENWTTGQKARQVTPYVLQALERGTGADDDKIGLIEWVVQKHQAVVEDKKKMDQLTTPQEKEKVLLANAVYMKGIPRTVFERAEEAIGEEIGEDAKDLIMPLADLKQRKVDLKSRPSVSSA
ncbi:coth protein-domain-containing protein [Chlamydoabsidia padenii]|nr:coth protein-domain-containing protein [Chlamydoabsidia padenii]